MSGAEDLKELQSRLGLQYLSMWYGYPGWTPDRFRLDWAHILWRIMKRHFEMLDGQRPPKLRKERGELEKGEKAKSKQAAKRKKTSGKAPTPAVLCAVTSFSIGSMRRVLLGCDAPTRATCTWLVGCGRRRGG